MRLGEVGVPGVGWEITGELVLDPEGCGFVDGACRMTEVMLCRVNHTLGVRVLYTTSLVTESVNWVLKRHREERNNTLIGWLSEVLEVMFNWRRSGRN
jgi:hypothetical protein